MIFFIYHVFFRLKLKAVQNEENLGVRKTLLKILNKVNRN